MLPDLRQKPLGDRRERLILVPDQVEFCFENRVQRPENESAAGRRVHQFRERQRAAESLFHEHGRIVREPEGSFQPQGGVFLSRPLTDVAFPALDGREQRKPFQVRSLDRFLFRERGVFRKDQPPDVAFGKFDEVVFSRVRQIAKDREIQKPLVQFLRDLFGISAGDVVLKSGTALLEGLDLSGEVADLVGFGQPEIQISARDVVQREKLLLDLVRHREQVLRAVA